MFKIVLWKEVREHLMTFRFGASLLTTFVLIIISVWVLGGDYLGRLDSFNTLSENYALEQAGIIVPSQAVPKLSYPPSPLGIFAQGEMRRFGNFVVIERWSVPREAGGTLSKNELLESIASFDLMTIFLFVISLFGILISYDSISGERENGTLKQLCVGRTTRGGLYFAKFLGLNAVLAIPFLVSFICALVVLHFLLGITFTPPQWPAIALMVFSGLLYGAVFIAAGMLGSSLCKRSSTAIVMTLLFWALGVFVIPIAGTRLAEALVPSPSSLAVSSFEEATEKDISARCLDFVRNNWPDDFETTVFSSVDFRRGGPDNIVFDGSPGAYRFISEIVRTFEPQWQRRAEEVWNLVVEQNARRSDQAWLADLLSWASPAHHLRAVFTSLARTGYSQYVDFLSRARAYRRQFLQSLEQKEYWGENASLFYSRRPREQIDTPEEYAARRREYRERNRNSPGWSSHGGSMTDIWDEVGALPGDLLPPFNYSPLESDFHMAAGPLGVLFVFVVVILFTGIIAFSKYDVR